MRDVERVLATDCGSTTTKAILIERRPSRAPSGEDPPGDEYRLVARGEAPTTVEAPVEDVTRGVLNAVREVEELRGRRLLGPDGILKPRRGDDGVDLYVSTSSAGGGLQMMVAGVVGKMTAESAARAALGAGAIVMDTIATDDGRLPHQKIERIRQLRPDMILLAGGTDGGTVSHVVELAELLRAAQPRPRLGTGYELPVIYAGNAAAREEIARILRGHVGLTIVDNLRAVLEAENLGPARERIHDLFMEHVMAQAPGYRRLMEWTDAPIMPTPGAMGLLVQAVAAERRKNVVAVDIGGATTDVFSVFDGTFNRTVSANLGMSYSISNVLLEAGVSNILRWVALSPGGRRPGGRRIDEADLRDRIGNKMIRPTTVPETLEELKVEQAIAREALRLAFAQHRQFAVGLAGVQRERTISDAFRQTSGARSLVDTMKLDLLIGSGGVLSHAPRRAQAARMLIDAFEPEGVTELAVDSIFMMPHLGLLSTVHAKAATDVFERDCLVRLGACVAPAGQGKRGQPCARVRMELPGGERGERVKVDEEIAVGELRRFPCGDDGEVRAVIEPRRGFDVGAGRGEAREATLRGGVVGLILDCRGRPLEVPVDSDERMALLRAWSGASGEYEA